MDVRVLNNHLVVQTNSPQQIQAIFPNVKEATVNGETYCAVPHTVDSARVLNNIGIKAPSPILTEYNWRGRFTPRWYQYDTAEFFTLNPRCHCHNAPRCVDNSTEFLTPAGWKSIDTYRDGDLVAQWNSGTDSAEFVHPTEYIDMPCDEMVHITTSTGVDQMLTANHRVPYYTSGSSVLRETTAGRIHETNSRKVYGWRGRLPVTFNAPVRAGLFMSDDEIRVMVMVIADGSFNQSKSSRCYLRLKKDRKKERARELLRNSGIQYEEKVLSYSTTEGYSLFKFDAPSREKEFGERWWGATGRQLQVIVDEVQHWDSSPRRSAAFAFSTYVRESADFVQYAASATKRTASLNSCVRDRRGKIETEFVVYVRGDGEPLGVGSRISNIQENSKKVPAPGGRCYCFSVPSTYLILRRNGCIFITGNTGKTNSALWAADYLKSKGIIHRVLIVAPLSTLWDVWEQAIFESFPLATFCVLHGSKQKRLELLEKKFDYYIVNHHGVKLIEADLKKRTDIDLIIVDEVAVMRNTKAETLFKPLNRVINQQGVIRWAWGLTGTPTPNDPTDAFGQSKLINPDTYKGHFTSFKMETMMQLGPFRWVARKGAENSVSRILKPSIRFERSVCTDMLPCYIERRAQLSSEQEKAYKQLIREAATEINGSTITAVNAAVLLSKLIQTACGVVIASDGSLARFDFGPRLAVLEELIEENTEKVVVLVPFTAPLDALAVELRKRWSVAVVDGRTSTGKRTQIFRDFRSCQDPHIILAHPAVLAHGLDLTAATLTIWYAPTWKAETYQQANARTDGSRQQVKIDVAHIYATGEERRIYQALKEKGRLQDIVLALSKGGM